MRALSVVPLLVLLAWSPRTQAQPEERPPQAPKLMDRVVVRWRAPELGGAAKMQFIFERELAFEARVEALIDGEDPGMGYSERHIRAALDRHIAETLLAALPVVPPPTPKEVATRAEGARTILEQRVGGRVYLLKAASKEGIASSELDSMLRRQARASIYLDRMVTPMLEPTRLELRELHQSGGTPYTKQPFDQVRDLVERFVVADRLGKAIDDYYRNARTRITVLIRRR